MYLCHLELAPETIDHGSYSNQYTVLVTYSYTVTQLYIRGYDIYIGYCISITLALPHEARSEWATGCPHSFARRRSQQYPDPRIPTAVTGYRITRHRTHTQHICHIGSPRVLDRSRLSASSARTAIWCLGCSHPSKRRTHQNSQFNRRICHLSIDVARTWFHAHTVTAGLCRSVALLCKVQARPRPTDANVAARIPCVASTLRLTARTALWLCMRAHTPRSSGLSHERLRLAVQPPSPVARYLASSSSLRWHQQKSTCCHLLRIHIVQVCTSPPRCPGRPRRARHSSCGMSLASNGTFLLPAPCLPSRHWTCTIVQGGAAVSAPRPYAPHLRRALRTPAPSCCQSLSTEAPHDAART